MTEPPLDLSPARGQALVEAAVVRQHLARITAMAADRPVQQVVLEELARLAALVEAMEGRLAADRRSREEMLRIDPLPFIPLERQASATAAPAMPKPGPHELNVAAPDFNGSGWWHAERAGDGSLRWSGVARSATVLLPALGGGALEVTLRLRSPFGHRLDMAEHPTFLDGVPLTFEAVHAGQDAGVFRAGVRLPEMPPGARVTLLLTGPRYDDPSTAPNRDTRRLGLGLSWVRVERAG